MILRRLFSLLLCASFAFAPVAVAQVPGNKVTEPPKLLSDAEQNHLRVIDDGQGLAANKKISTGIGLQIMTSRARLLGGAFRMESGRDGGTVISCSCPHKGNL